MLAEKTFQWFPLDFDTGREDLPVVSTLDLDGGRVSPRLPFACSFLPLIAV